jgi:hypothetical protein
MSRTKHPAFGALFRNDAGGLEIRHYPTAAEAALVAAERELTEMHSLKGTRSTVLARELGLSPRTLRRRWLAKEIPGIEHGPRRLLIPREACRLIRLFGLWRYVQLRRTGAGAFSQARMGRGFPDRAIGGNRKAGTQGT